MKVHGLMFKDPLVRAIMADLKTQTRRKLGTFYDVGDRIYVKECYSYAADGQLVYRADLTDEQIAEEKQIRRLAPKLTQEHGARWRSSMFMPRSAARIWLEITDARVERLQDISERDAMAEGAPLWDIVLDAPVEVTKRTYGASWRLGFQRLWDSIHGEDAWADNPEVRVITFRRITGGAS